MLTAFRRVTGTTAMIRPILTNLAKHSQSHDQERDAASIGRHGFGQEWSWQTTAGFERKTDLRKAHPRSDAHKERPTDQMSQQWLAMFPGLPPQHMMEDPNHLRDNQAALASLTAPLHRTAMLFWPNDPWSS
jgi:hypothetical protein